jgi:uncharacterized protein YhdP
VTYDPRWPSIDNLSGHVLLDAQRLSVQTESGRVLRSSLDAATVVVEPVNGQRRLRVRGRIKGDVADGLQVINESPIAAFTAGALQDWRAKGTMELKLDLDMPLAGPLDAKVASLRVDADIGATSLYLGDLNVPLTDVRGLLQYDLQGGLSSRAINGALWGKALSATITNSVDDPAMMHIAVDGSVSVDDLAGWLKVDTGSFIAGQSDFRLLLHQVRGQGFHTTVESDLVGVSSTLPQPLAKSATTPIKLRYVSRVADGHTRMRLDYANVLRAVMLRDHSGVVSGDIAFGVEPADNVEGLRIGGAIESADVGAWIVAAQTLLSRNIERGGDHRHALRIENLRVASGELVAARVMGLDFDSRWEGDDFLLSFDSDLVTGDFRVPAAAGETYSLRITSLQLQPFLAPLIPPAAAVTVPPAAGGPDAATVAPARDTVAMDPNRWNKLRDVRLPPIGVTIDALRHGERELGQWNFRIASTADALELSQIEATLTGLHVHGLESGGGASYRLGWKGDQPRSELRASLDIRNLGEFFANWGYARVIESRQGRVDVAFDWPGYPVDLRMAKVQGLLDFTLRDGHLAQESSNNPMIRALGLLSIDQILRRLRFDFKDIYQSGLTFDRFEGAVDISNGQARTREPIELKGPSAHILLTGQSNLEQRTLDADLVVTLPIGSNLPWLAALAGGPAAAAGAFVASRLFESQIGKFSSALYQVSGSMDDPKLELVKVFDLADKAKSGANAASESTSDQTAVPGDGAEDAARANSTESPASAPRSVKPQRAEDES